MTRIVVADDHAMFREGLLHLLRLSDMEVVAECSNGTEALKAIIGFSPDIALLDVSMPDMDGISVTEQSKSLSPKTKIIILTIHDSPEVSMRAFSAGVSGYLLKECAFKELLIAIETVQSGCRYISPSIREKFPFESNPSNSQLTKREKEILKHVGLGLSNREIADKLFISIKTVDVHRTNIMKKLNIHSTASLVHYAMKSAIS
jgi:two-component system response regulator NreC